jgi:hypothetical protein
MKTPLQIIQTILKNARNPEVVRPLCAPDVKYVSLNYDNPDLKKVEPWCGTHIGYEGIVETFTNVNRFWTVEKFEPSASFESGENVAIFGSFTLTSKTLNITKTSPFAIFGVVKEGKVTYMQYMEDTFASAATFRSGGVWKFRSNPDGSEVEV